MAIPEGDSHFDRLNRIQDQRGVPFVVESRENRAVSWLVRLEAWLHRPANPSVGDDQLDRLNKILGQSGKHQ